MSGGRKKNAHSRTQRTRFLSGLAVALAAILGTILIAKSRTGSAGPIAGAWVRVTPEKKGVTEFWELKPEGAFAYRRISDATRMIENEVFGRWHVDDSVLAVWLDDEPWSVRRLLGGASDKTPIFLIGPDEFGLGGKEPRNTYRRSKNLRLD